METIYTVRGIKGYKKWYDYCYKNNNMITKRAEERIKILMFWEKYGIEATEEAYGAKRSTLFEWRKKLKGSGGKIESLNPDSQARKRTNKREINLKLLQEIKRLRLEVCPNMGKAKIKKFLDKFSEANKCPIYSESKIGRIIKDKKIYHHRQKISHFGKIKVRTKQKKKRKPKGIEVNEPGKLIEVDTIVKYVGGLKRYIITAIDTFGRPAFALSYKKANSINTRDFFRKLEKVMPFEIKGVQTDNGSEFNLYFKEYLKKQKIEHYWNYPGQPYRNGHIEKFNRTIQEEFIDQNEYLLSDPDIFNRKLIDWLLWYNTERPHWSLDLESPINYLIKHNFLSNMCWTNTRA